MIYPEGAWNVSPNLVVMKIFTGTVRIAQETGAEIIPIAVEQYDDTFYFNIGENYKISRDSNLSIDEINGQLRDKLATLKWEIIETQPSLKRDELPDGYLDKFQSDIVMKCNYGYGFSLEDAIAESFHDKNVVTEEEVFAFLENVDIVNMKNTEIYHKAVEIFNNHHNTNKFINDNNEIIVSNTDIKESINKINNNSLQKKYLKEHLLIFSDLGDIIEKSNLVNQTFENKNRESNKIWSYYLNGLNVNNSKFLFEFDVISKENGENHYRVQRLEKIEKKQTLPSESANFSTDSNLATSAFSENNIPHSNINVKSGILPTINNMQNNENDTNKLAPTREDFESTKTNKILNPNEIAKLTKEDVNTTPILPVKASTNKVNDGNSHFAKNIKDKVNMLNAEQKAEILSKEDVRYYDKVTNKESLEKAFKRLNAGGKAEVTRWFNNNENIDSSDVAEGYILLKQYSDKAENAINLAEKDYYNEMVVETAKKMRKLGTTAGQIVQAFNIMERMTPEGMVKYSQSELSEAYDRMIKNKSKEWIDKHREDFDLKPDEVQFIMDTMKEVSEMEDGYGFSLEDAIAESFHDKNVVTEEEVFAFLENVDINSNNAFLARQKHELVLKKQIIPKIH